MKTLRLSVDPGCPDSADSRAALLHAAAILREGGLVAFPTETVYGLGANALDAKAVEKIFLAKQRPGWDPLITHIADFAMLQLVSDLPLGIAAAALAAAFWPGPLTLLLPKSAQIPEIVTAGRTLAGVRMPAHPIAHALIAAAGLPIAAPSANRFGRTSPTTATHVLEDLDGRIDAVLDAGETTHGLESTVVDAAETPVTIYRPGIITIDQISSLCGAAQFWQPAPASEITESPASLPSPGVGIRHYAPRAHLLLLEGEAAKQPTLLLEALARTDPGDIRTGIMLPSSFLDNEQSTMLGSAIIFEWGEWSNVELLGQRLFAGLRALDAAGADQILCPLPPAAGLGAAIRDRLTKAAKKAYTEM